MRILNVIDGICTRAAAAPAAAPSEPAAGSSSAEPAGRMIVRVLGSYLPRMLEALLQSAGGGTGAAVQNNGMPVRVRKMLARWEKKSIFLASELARPRELLEAAEAVVATSRAATAATDAAAAAAAAVAVAAAQALASAAATRSSRRHSSGRSGAGGDEGSAAAGVASGDESDGISLPPTPNESRKSEEAQASNGYAAHAAAAAAAATPAMVTVTAPTPASLVEGQANAARFKKLVEAERAEKKRKKIEARLRPEGETQDEESASAWDSLRAPAEGEVFVLQVLASPYGSCYEFAPYWSLSQVRRGRRSSSSCTLPHTAPFPHTYRQNTPARSSLGMEGPFCPRTAPAAWNPPARCNSPPLQITPARLVAAGQAAWNPPARCNSNSPPRLLAAGLRRGRLSHLGRDELRPAFRLPALPARVPLQRLARARGEARGAPRVDPWGTATATAAAQPFARGAGAVRRRRRRRRAPGCC